MSSKPREGVSQKSAAEFFSEHQQIAGFDNPGKSLFTSIRELVENSLDAAESIHVLPTVRVTIEEYTEKEHNAQHGIKTSSLSPVKENTGGGEMEVDGAGGAADDKDEGSGSGNTAAAGQAKEPKKISAKAAQKAAAEKSKAADKMYYRISCCDNGCGIPEENIGNLLGRVLSGSKHGIRQTRGKFGLGAKMALIWSKKSSGLPIEVRTAHATSEEARPSAVVHMVLDIDIYKNLPKVISTSRSRNEEGWRGTEITLTIAGNFSAYRQRILQYFQQLAVITPYADLDLDFRSIRDEKKTFHCEFRRRSTQMPPMATEIKPHPHSLNNITLSNLLKMSTAAKVSLFLTKDLSGISAATANTITASTRLNDKSPRHLDASQIAALCQRLRDEPGVRPPNSACLSPAGEYNLRLGVIKELEPHMVATYTEKADSVEGHPFLVEAAISLGGHKVREGINVYRFANRIPLLFEVGADVVTVVATKGINWSSYHINQNSDRVGVYVSIVSTRIPFKGTSKEYIGEDVTEIKAAVKKCLSACCLQLKANLASRMQQNQERERKKALVKYIPNISKSLATVLQKMHDRIREEGGSSSSSSSSGSSSSRSGRFAISESIRNKAVASIAAGEMTEAAVLAGLQRAVDRFEQESSLQSAALENAQGKGQARLPFVFPQVPMPLPIDNAAWTTVVGTSGGIKILFGCEPPAANFDFADDIYQTLTQAAAAAPPIKAVKRRLSITPASASGPSAVALSETPDELAPLNLFASKGSGLGGGSSRSSSNNSSSGVKNRKSIFSSPYDSSFSTDNFTGQGKGESESGSGMKGKSKSESRGSSKGRGSSAQSAMDVTSASDDDERDERRPRQGSSSSGGGRAPSRLPPRAGAGAGAAKTLVSSRRRGKAEAEAEGEGDSDDDDEALVPVPPGKRSRTTPRTLLSLEGGGEGDEEEEEEEEEDSDSDDEWVE